MYWPAVPEAKGRLQRIRPRADRPIPDRLRQGMKQRLGKKRKGQGSRIRNYSPV